MSQVLAAKAASGVSPPAQEARRAAQSGEGFSAVFGHVQKASRLERQTAGRSEGVDQSETANRSTRRDQTRVKDKAVSRHSREADSDGPGRVDRLQDAAEKARAGRAERNDADGHARGARQEAEPHRSSSEEKSGQEQNRSDGEANRESNDHEVQQLSGQALLMQTPTPAYAQTGHAGDSGEGSPGGAFVPPGSPVYLSGSAVPVSAQADGAPGEALPVTAPGAQTNGPQAIPAALQSDAASGPSTSGKAKPEAGAQGVQAKPATSADFQTVLMQAGRSRQAGLVAKPATAAAVRAESAEPSVAMNDASGPEELARVLRSRVGARHSNMTIQLDPPELGRVRVDVRMHNDLMTVRFETQTQAGHDAIQDRMRELTGALEQQGVRLDRVEVEYRPPPDGQQREGQLPQQHSGQQYQEPRFAGDGGQSGTRRESPAFNGPSATEGVTPSASLQARADLLAASGVDVVI